MHLAHAALWVTDLDRTIAFYEAIGLERRRSFELDGTENVYLGAPADGDDAGARDGGDALQLRHDPDRTTPIAPSRADVDHLALAVDDAAAVDAAFAAAVEAGASVLADPHAVDPADSYAAFVEDPEGYTLEFVAPLAETTPSD